MSNLIKPSNYISLEDMKMIENAARFHKPHRLDPALADASNDGVDEEAAAEEQQMIVDAEQVAEDIVRKAMEEAERIQTEADDQIEQWWTERRLLDEQTVDEAKHQGFESGYEAGFSEGSQNAMQEYHETLQQAGRLIQEAHRIKDAIVQEAEPFLVELSVSIAEKIISHQLTLSPEWVLDLVRRSLSRRRELGLITLCVSPAQFQYVQDAKDELALVLDSQAELQILPDSTVADHGCVIRSSFGSIDARIDTQLGEIKKNLLQIASREVNADEDSPGS